LIALPIVAQEFQIGGDQPQQQAPRKKGAQPQAGAPSTGLGWGSSIEVGRLARAAEDSLRRGNNAQAADFAERAVKAAPQNPKLWFLLGYTSRLAGRFQNSLNAYQRGLKAEPGNSEGLSGMAQTYAKMGRVNDAKRILLQLVNSRNAKQNDLLVAGELFLQTGDIENGTRMLQRAEAMKPSAHAELLLAIAYTKTKQPAKAKQMLDMARKRDPKNVAVFRAVANFYREERDYKAAIDTLKAAPGQNTDLLGDLAYTYEIAGEKQNAADTYAKAAKLSPQQIGLQMSAGQALMRTGQLQDARAFLARAEAIDSNHYRLHAIRAQMARMENKPEEAVREYNIAISRLPKEGVPEGELYPVQLRLNLADLYREQGDDANAKQQIALAEQEVNKLQIEGPARAEFLRVRASIKLSANDIAGAEKDLKEALQLDAKNDNVILQYANLLWRSKRKDEARKLYAGILEKDPRNRFALEAMGYLFREDNDVKGAEQFFSRLAQMYPDDYVPYLALGDLYTQTHDFTRADSNYEQAYKRAPKNAVVVANAANAAIEAQQIPLATKWIGRAEGSMLDDARVMRERERVAFHNGKYSESAQLGQKVLQQLPNDRNASVYLAYALYNLGRYDDVLALTEKYAGLLPKEPNFPLLSGHVHKQSQLLQDAVEDYTRAIQLDKNMVDAYVNRGYVFNDLQNAEEAMQDFNSALKVQPNNGVAHLGLAFSNLQLRRGKAALDATDTAERLLGESGATHLARATAYRQMRLLEKAESEYLVAMKYAPDDLPMQLALADTQYHARKYAASVKTLNGALRLSPDDSFIYSQLAHANAQLGNRAETLRYVQLAEAAPSEEQGSIFLATGESLLALGDREAAMERFARALEAPDANRVNARLAVARLFTRDREFEDARQQISLAFAEARVGEASPITADNLIEAANLFLAMHDFDLATRYFERAKNAGAADEVVAIGLANTYIAQGQTNDAEVQLASLGSPSDWNGNYDYTMAMANIYRQRRDIPNALTSFARANSMSGDEDVAERALHEVAGEEGLRINPRLSVFTDFDMGGIYEDQTIYELDRRLFQAPDDQLPAPRSSLESRWTAGYRVHQGNLPVISGFFQVRNARGDVSLPSESLIIERNTFDYSVNGGVNPVLRVGGNSFMFNAGLQYTWRRDKLSPVEINQNLFRQFVYMSSNALGNWLTVRGNAYHESGPFTGRDLSSRDIGARLEFVVGRPWGRTALITSYSVRNLNFEPLRREFFTTSTGLGIQRKFGEKLNVTVLGEYLRSWRLEDFNYAIAQAIRPVGQINYRVNNRWSVDGSFAWSRGQGSHFYDNVQSGFFISYVRPMRRTLDDGAGGVPVEYPLRFSFGVQSANYLNITGRDQTLIRPVIRLTFF
jgi:tetratricopeptide (TPR) repeat protein